MPIYEYLCESCGKVNERLQKVGDPPPARCDECDSRKLAKLVQSLGKKEGIGKEQIVVTEIPYGVNRALLCERIAELVNEKTVGFTDITAIRDKLVNDGTDPVGGTPEEFQAHIKREMQKWGKVVRDNNIRME